MGGLGEISYKPESGSGQLAVNFAPAIECRRSQMPVLSGKVPPPRCPQPQTPAILPEGWLPQGIQSREAGSLVWQAAEPRLLPRQRQLRARPSMAACPSGIPAPLALQDVSNPQPIENLHPKTSCTPSPLQDVSLLQTALLAGLIAVLTGHTLQEDIAESVRRFINRGRDILRMVPESPDTSSHENQAHPPPRATASRASPV